MRSGGLSAGEFDAGAGGIRVAFAGGGTGGHVVPGLHLLAHAHDAGEAPADLLWFTSGRAVEERAFGGAAELLGARPCERVALPLEPSGGGAPARAGLALRTPRALVRARERLRAHHSEVLLGLGGFASLPAVLAARSLSIPVALLEVNAVDGAATRWLAPFAQRTLHAFGDGAAEGRARATSLLPHGMRLRTGAPLAPELARGPADEIECARAKTALGFDPARPLALVLGGSQGAAALNAFVGAHGARILERGVQILHQTGPGRLGEAAAPRAGYRAVEYLDPIRAPLAAATVALARGGASTLCELAALQVPAFVAPYPRAKDDHQARNAEALGAGVRVVPDARLDARAADELAALASEEGDAARRVMRTALARAVATDGAAQIWNELARLAARAPWNRTRADGSIAEHVGGRR